MGKGLMKREEKKIGKNRAKQMRNKNTRKGKE